jgi:hypothetical protein
VTTYNCNEIRISFVIWLSLETRPSQANRWLSLIVLHWLTLGFVIFCGFVYRWDCLDPVWHHVLIIVTGIGPETSVTFNQLTCLIAQEDFYVMCLLTNPHPELHIALSLASILDLCDKWSVILCVKIHVWNTYWYISCIVPMWKMVLQEKWENSGVSSGQKKNRIKVPRAHWRATG